MAVQGFSVMLFIEYSSIGNIYNLCSAIGISDAPHLKEERFYLRVKINTTEARFLVLLRRVQREGCQEFGRDLETHVRLCRLI